MKKFLGLICLILVGTVGWRIGENLSSDAISMALGVFFGVLAGIPAALLVVASDRQQAPQRGAYAYGMTQQPPPAYPPAQPPVIVLNGSGTALPQAARRFKVVGEQEEWLEEWQ